MKMSIHPADLYAGRQLKRVRMSKGMTQDAMAEILGVTFQQIQKYEKGNNRMSVSVIDTITSSLNVPVSVFFNPNPEEEDEPYLTDKSTARVIKLFTGIKNPKTRSALLHILELAAKEEQ